MKIKLPQTVDNFLGILRVERGPDVLPASLPLLAASLVAFALAEFGWKLLTHTPARAAEIGVAGALLLAAVALVCARTLNLSERLTQTLTALAAAGAVIALVNLLLRLLLRGAFMGMEMDALPIDSISNFLLFPLFAWNGLVYFSIFRRGFQMGILLSVALSLGLTVALALWLPLLFR